MERIGPLPWTARKKLPFPLGFARKTMGKLEFSWDSHGKIMGRWRLARNIHETFIWRTEFRVKFEVDVFQQKQPRQGLQVKKIVDIQM